MTEGQGIGLGTCRSRVCLWSIPWTLVTTSPHFVGRHSTPAARRPSLSGWLGPPELNHGRWQERKERPALIPPWLDGTREPGRAPLSRGTLCPSLRPLSWAGDTDQQESASLLALVMSLLQGLSGTSRPTDPHPHPHSEKLPIPRGFRFVLVFTRLLWFLEACKLWGNSREPHTLRARPPLRGDHRAWPWGPAMREVPPQQPVAFLGTNGQGECGAGHGQPRSSSPALGSSAGGLAQLPGTLRREEAPAQPAQGSRCLPFLAGCGRGNANRLSPDARATSSLDDVRHSRCVRWACLGQQGLPYLS
ncbi:uncharacterized protein LOC102420331 isoform X1 [Myotis lucifugus]|uniref:uncharacterized protein LOC102420331 isoform X1 n=1 Tax=Myotis lucifugus TaxID=59463 RepID=UPI0006D70FC8|nr:uncharacterized protein LOC102420331 isoform X1 [Myotis lucifugus]XP_023604942.1 uncharacterized protein LOC102420331 isoform X1 [Myotis lucifugus]